MTAPPRRLDPEVHRRLAAEWGDPPPPVTPVRHPVPPHPNAPLRPVWIAVDADGGLADLPPLPQGPEHDWPLVWEHAARGGVWLVREVDAGPPVRVRWHWLDATALRASRAFHTYMWHATLDFVRHADALLATVDANGRRRVWWSITSVSLAAACTRLREWAGDPLPLTEPVSRAGPETWQDTVAEPPAAWFACRQVGVERLTVEWWTSVWSSERRDFDDSVPATWAVELRRRFWGFT